MLCVCVCVRVCVCVCVVYSISRFLDGTIYLDKNAAYGQCPAAAAQRQVVSCSNNAVTIHASASNSGSRGGGSGGGSGGGGGGGGSGGGGGGSEAQLSRMELIRAHYEMENFGDVEVKPAPKKAHSDYEPVNVH